MRVNCVKINVFISRAVACDRNRCSGNQHNRLNTNTTIIKRLSNLPKIEICIMLHYSILNLATHNMYILSSSRYNIKKLDM